MDFSVDTNSSNIIKHLESIYSSNNMTYERLFNEFDLLEPLRFIQVPFTKGGNIFRCRLNKNNRSFTNVSKISYPSACKVKDYSRANRPNQQLFYASDSEDACLAEMIPIWNKQIYYRTRNYITTMSMWKITKRIKLILIPDFQNTSYTEIIRRLNMNENQRTFWKYITNKFKTDILKDELIYKFTAAFANVLRDKIEKKNIKVDGILYSSVKLKNKVNVAIDPHLIDTKSIIPIGVKEFNVRITGLNSKGMPTYNVSEARKRGVIQGSQIKWDY